MPSVDLSWLWDSQQSHRHLVIYSFPDKHLYALKRQPTFDQLFLLAKLSKIPLAQWIKCHLLIVSHGAAAERSCLFLIRFTFYQRCDSGSLTSLNSIPLYVCVCVCERVCIHKFVLVLHPESWAWPEALLGALSAPKLRVARLKRLKRLNGNENGVVLNRRLMPHLSP